MDLQHPLSLSLSLSSTQTTMYSSSWKKYADDRRIAALPKQRTFKIVKLWNDVIMQAELKSFYSKTL
jgi:hypothetical protein